MSTLSITEALNLMQSDMGLWDKAEKTSTKDGELTLTITLPWGIGKQEVTFQGITNGQTKRNALESYGSYIRDLIRNQIDDDAITARAKAAAARVESAYRADRDSGGNDWGLGGQGVPSETLQGTDQAYEENVKVNVRGRAIEVAWDATGALGRIKTLLADLQWLVNEIEGVTDAPTNRGTSKESIDGKATEESATT